MLPTTTPVQFEPDALHATVDRLMSYQPQRIFQTHFGPVTDLERLARDLHAAIVELVRIARLHADAPDRRARIEADMFRYFSARLDEHGYTGDLARRHELLDDDVRLNTAGSRSGSTGAELARHGRPTADTAHRRPRLYPLPYP